jgi:hypothetical protein
VEKIEEFKNLLHESKVTKYMSWEDAIPFICFDDRYTVIPKNDRKVYFNDYIKSLNENKEKKIIKKESIEKFKEFLKGIPIDNSLTFVTFTQKYSQDMQFSLLSESDKMTLFDEYYVPLQQKIENNNPINLDSIQNFLEKLNEMKGLSIQSKWNDVKNLFEDFSSVNDELLEKEFYNFLFEKFETNEKSSSEDDEENEPEIKHEEKMDPKDEFISLLTEFKENKKISANTPTMGKKFKDLKKSLSSDPRYSKISEDSVDDIISNFIWNLKK